MCQYASFFHNPLTGEVQVSVLDSHGETEKKLNLDPEIWQDGHYLPNGEFQLRLTGDEKIDKVEYEEKFRNLFVLSIKVSLLLFGLASKFSVFRLLLFQFKLDFISSNFFLDSSAVIGFSTS